MKQCELCDRPARMYCDSDQANLCWECDAAVHGANFLVARHSRNLLCRSCQSPTPWRAEGARLGPTVSICLRCVGCKNGTGPGGCASVDEGEEIRGVDGHRGGDGDGVDDERDDDGEEVEDEDGEEEEDGENQVVPWALTPPPPPSPSSSEGEESLRSGNSGFSKRKREDENLSGPQDDLYSSPSHRSCHGPDPTPEAPAGGGLRTRRPRLESPPSRSRIERDSLLFSRQHQALPRPLSTSAPTGDRLAVDLMFSSSSHPPI